MADEIQKITWSEAVRAVALALKDKVGRKQLIALATLGCLTFLIYSKVTDIKPLAVVLAAGVIGMVLQALLDWKRPREKE